MDMIDDQVVVDLGPRHGNHLADGDGAGGNAASKLGLDLGPIPGLDLILTRADRRARTGANQAANRRAGARVTGGGPNRRAGAGAEQPAKQGTFLRMRRIRLAPRSHEEGRQNASRGPTNRATHTCSPLKSFPRTSFIVTIGSARTHLGSRRNAWNIEGIGKNP